MTNTDVIFKLYGEGDRPDPNCFCHFGWEGTGAFAFEKYAMAYYDSAEILFSKFKESPGNYGIIDGIGLTICFLYRHYVELMLKQLYLRHVCTSEDDFKEYLEKGHNLKELWSPLKPRLKFLKDRVALKVDLGSVEHYINEFHNFDENSMSLRYPIDKKLNPNHDNTRLDIFNLHERMGELSKAFADLTHGLSNQLFESVPEDKISNFDRGYTELRPHLKSVINELKEITIESSGSIDFFDSHSYSSSSGGGYRQVQSILKKCSSDEIILLDTLFYTGRDIICGLLKLPKNPYEARCDVKKGCILKMDYDLLEFGKEPEVGQINIWEKKRDSLVMNIETATKYLDFVGDKDTEDTGE